MKEQECNYSRFQELSHKYSQISTHWLTPKEEKPVMTNEERTELEILYAHFCRDSWFR
jgi:hypothetical protein